VNSTGEPHRQAEIASRTDEFIAREASKPFGWNPAHFVEWATVAAMIEAVGLKAGARVLDVGSGSGWTSLFLAEAGFEVTGYDLVPANAKLGRRRAERWGLRSAGFEVADMEHLPAGDLVDAVLLLDALHHSARQAEVLQSVAGRLLPGGWLLLGEPSWLHRVSPDARATTRELGWLERGLTLRSLRRDLVAAGFATPRRFVQPTNPYERGARGFAWQLARLLGASAWVAPSMHLWLAARRG
jgi:2-polyprenyl-3-methyl-5-hydroxy-6-metoxy-1,4-benzoquinol methylase